MKLEIIRTVKEIREHVRKQKENGKTIALIPTMGGLHDGHLSLIERAKEIADHVIVSIFVNPKQFNNPDDLETYPSDEKADLKNIESLGADVVFIPTAKEMYPDEFATDVKVTASVGILCDAHRPGHFDGVATVVTKLFMQVGADFACFGEKDYQQLFIIQRLVQDLNIPIKIIPVPTVREKDGLAMSSRNERLTANERNLAPELQKAMQEVLQNIHSGMNAKQACKEAWNLLEADGLKHYLAHL